MSDAPFNAAAEYEFGESQSQETANAPQHKNSVGKISFVIPVMNEECTIEELVDRIWANVDDPNRTEIILIDDGSTDNSWAVINSLAVLFPGRIRGIRFRSNRGKAAALQAGFNVARGEIVFTMDADLQDDPQEIPRFIEKLNEGYDLVSGWKAVRHDPWHKVLPSRIFNRMLSRFSRVKLHDHNCGFKCYRRSVVESIELFGELHRMVPSLAGMQGFRVAEIVVNHHPRQFGRSKYGIERFIRGFSDMLTIGFLRVYRERPSHFANAAASAYAAVAGVVFCASIPFGVTTSTVVFSFLASLSLLGMAGLCVFAGLFAELMIRQNANAAEAANQSVVEDTRDFPNARIEEACDVDSEQSSAANCQPALAV